MGKKVKITWSAVAKTQYYDTLIFGMNITNPMSIPRE